MEQSQWNLENRFTGWKDIELSEKGIFRGKRIWETYEEKKKYQLMQFTQVNLNEQMTQLLLL